jgi:coenzyme F420-reducing hydrogenase alpha subunit
VGGFYRIPTKKELEALVPELEWALDAAAETVRLVSGFTFPKVDEDYEFVSLSNGDEYPIDDGRIVSSGGIDIAPAEFNEFFVEEHVARSNALHSTIIGRGAYYVGPLARYALNFEKLTASARDLALEAGLGPVVTNPFQSIVVRAVETFYAVEEALRIIDGYEPPLDRVVDYTPCAGEGHGVSEAPRGMLYHRYRIDEDARIADAQIVPPTAQNQLTIESDLRAVLETHLDLPDPELSWILEQSIRNYDPCISCATHFLDLTVERVGGGADRDD